MTPRSPGLLPEHCAAVCLANSRSTGQGRCALGRQPLPPPSPTHALRGCGKRLPVIPDAVREVVTVFSSREVCAMSLPFSRLSRKTPFLASHPRPSEMLA
jgi:hypothetical protein